MKFIQIRFMYVPHWNEPQGWKALGWTWIKTYPFVIAYSWMTPEVAEFWYDTW